MVSLVDSVTCTVSAKMSVVSLFLSLPLSHSLSCSVCVCVCVCVCVRERERGGGRKVGRMRFAGWLDRFTGRMVGLVRSTKNAGWPFGTQRDKAKRELGSC